MDTDPGRLFSWSSAHDFIDRVMPMDGRDYGVISASPVEVEGGYGVKLCVERGYDSRGIKRIIEEYAKGRTIEIELLGGRAVSHIGQSNPSKYWFKRRRYGWGYVPSTWQGWATIIVYFVVMFGGLAAFGTPPEGDSGKEFGIFFVIFIVATTALLRISFTKGPRPKWRWGAKPTDNPDEDE